MGPRLGHGQLRRQEGGAGLGRGPLDLLQQGIEAGVVQTMAHHRRIRPLARQPQPDQFLRQTVQGRIAEPLDADLLQMIVQSFDVVDGGIGQGGGHRADGAKQGLHRLRPLKGLAQFGRRAEPAPPLPRRPGRALGAAGKQGVEPVEQVAAILLRQILVLNGRGRVPQPRLEPGLALGRVQRLGVLFATEQDLGETVGLGQGLAQGRRPLVAQDVVGVLTAAQQGETERPPRLQQRQRPFDGAIGGAQSRRVAVETQDRLGRHPPQPLHLFFGQGRAHRRHGRQARALAGDDVHIAFDHDDGLIVPALRPQDTPRLGQAIEGRPLVKQRAFGTVQIFGPVVGVHGPAAEADDPPARVQNGEDQPVAEPVIGLAAAVRRDQQPGLDQFGRPRPALDQGLFQPLAVIGRIAQAEPLPLILGQAALLKIFARRLARRAAQIGGEPFLGQVHPLGQA